MLKLQSNNMEAIAELASLVPQTQINGEDTSPIPSSSSSSSKPLSGDDTDYISEVLDRLNIALPKRPKPPPFPRTRADERKLKITLVAVSASEYEEISRGDKYHAYSNHKRKAKASLKEVDKNRVDAVVYPGWDRYNVKRMN